MSNEEPTEFPENAEREDVTPHDENAEREDVTPHDENAEREDVTPHDEAMDEDLAPGEEELRRRRAAAIRAEIERLTTGTIAPGEPPKSPRDFIERKMHELEERKEDD